MRRAVLVASFGVLVAVGLAVSLQASVSSVGVEPGPIQDANNADVIDPVDPNILDPNWGPRDPNQVQPANPDEDAPPPRHFDPWPGHVSERPGIMPPPIPWPLPPTHFLDSPDPNVQQSFQGVLPKAPGDPNGYSITVITTPDGKAIITLKVCFTDGNCEETQWIICDCPECNLSPCGNVTEISVWLGFSDWNNNGVFDPGDSYECVVSAYQDGTRINYHFFCTDDGYGWTEG